MPRIFSSTRTRDVLRRATVLGLAISASWFVAVQPAPTAQAAEIADDDWLGIVNAYRSQSSLGPLVENSTWSDGARNHSCWMLQNGIAHDEPAGTPGYTSSGDAAGNAGNVAVSGSTGANARYFIDLWMTAPFHAVGILRNSLQSTGFGLCQNTSTSPWKSAGTLDVIRGNDWSVPDPTTPVVFPGDGATTRLTRFIAESPDPRTFCGWSGKVVGLPLIALMPSSVSSASATLSGPSGPVDTCVLHKSNTSGVAKSILGGDNAVVVVPATKLETGAYTVSVNSNGGSAGWTFHVDPDASLSSGAEPAPPVDLPELRDTTPLGNSEQFTTVTPFRLADSRHGVALERLPARTAVRLKVAGERGIPADASSISANFTVDRASADGYLTVSDCNGVSFEVSTLNYDTRSAVANQSIVPLAPNGDICLYSHEATDIVIDVNGYASPGGDSRLTPVPPVRVADTRADRPLDVGETRTFQITGPKSGVPDEAAAAVINLTAADPQQTGWIVAFPCDVDQPLSSTLNVRAGRTRANSAIIPVSSEGKVCVRSTTITDILIDVTGWVSPTGAYEFTSLRPMRVTDTRSPHPGLNAGAESRPVVSGEVFRVRVAGVRGIPENAKAATLNVTTTGSSAHGFLQVVPCGAESATSTINFARGHDSANGTTVPLGDGGDVCVTASRTTHLILDITGTWG